MKPLAYLLDIEAPGAHGAALGAAQKGPFLGRGGRGRMHPCVLLPPLAAGSQRCHALCSLSCALHLGTVWLLKQASEAEPLKVQINQDTTSAQVDGSVSKWPALL